MQRTQILFLQLVLVLIGIGTLAFLLWTPWGEGVNANASTLSEIYFDDPFLAYAYAASIAFFIALYKAFKVLGYIANDALFSLASVRALQTIQYCAVALVGLVVLAEIFIVATMYGKDDIAGGVAMGLFAIFGCTVIAAAAAVFESVVRSAGAMKQHLPV